VLEQAWVNETGPRRLFLQSLIHFAVGCYHDQRGNSAGAARQLRKGLDKLAAYRPVFEDVDTEQLCGEALMALGRIESGERLVEYPQIKMRAPIR
jgi:predicted metal-dependent hydrolase